MTDRPPTFVESCHQLSAAFYDSLPAPLRRLLGKISLALRDDNIPAPVRYVCDKIDERWLNALLIAVYGAWFALILAIWIAKTLRWI